MSSQARQDAAPPEGFATPPHDSLPPATSFLSDAPILQTRHHLPHWEQSGTTCFATFRLADSLPAGKLEELREARARWLAAHPSPLSPADAAEYRTRFEETAECWLDASHGECLLRLPAARRAMEDALRHFDGVRYTLHAFVVMPNHVHVLFTPAAGVAVGKLLHSWKSFSAKAVNAALGRTGTVWEKESWDRFIRTRRHFKRTLSYIRSNPGHLSLPVYVAPAILAWLETSGGAASSRAPYALSSQARQDAAPSNETHIPSSGGATSSRAPLASPFPARQDAAPPSETRIPPSGGAASSRASHASPSPTRQNAAPPKMLSHVTATLNPMRKCLP